MSGFNPLYMGYTYTSPTQPIASLDSLITLPKDGLYDLTDQINAALSTLSQAGNSVITLSPGSYRIDKTITVPRGIKTLLLDDVILDGSRATDISLTLARHMQFTDGTLNALSPLTLSPVAGERTITLTDPTVLAQRDVLLIFDSAIASYSPWRDYYRAGEFCRVQSSSGALIRLQSGLFANYASGGTTSVYKLSNPNVGIYIRGLTIVGAGITTATEIGLYARHLVDSVLDNVNVYGMSYASASLGNCLNVQLNSCNFEDDGIDSWGADYGLLLRNCQDIFVNGGRYVAARHGVTAGGFDNTGDVPCRGIKFDGVHVGTTGLGTQPAFDFHGNVEHGIVTGCFIDGGISFGGNHHQFVGNTIRQLNPLPTIVGSEISGLNHLFSENKLFAFTPVAGRGLFFDVGGGGNVISSLTGVGGNLVFSGNQMDYTGTGDNSQDWLEIVNRGYAGNDTINVTIENNKLRSTNRLNNATLDVTSGKSWDNIYFEDNKTQNAGGLYTQASGALSCALRVHANRNDISGCYYYGFFVQQIKESITFKGNATNNQRLGGALLRGSATLNCGVIHVEGNTSMQDSTGSSGSGSTNIAWQIQYATRAIYHNNVADSDNEILTVTDNSLFVIGETITGSGGWTAVVKDKYATTGITIERTFSGAFVAGNITGSTSGTVTNCSAKAYTVTVKGYMANIGTLWQGANVHTRGLADSYNTVTTNNVI